MIDIFQRSDDDASGLIRAEEIDILINLNGYFGAPRMGLFAHRSAPVQVNYLGFPATLGASYMDYIIADRIVIPETEKQFYDEKVVWLPNSYQANDDKRGIAPTSPKPRRRRVAGKRLRVLQFQQYLQADAGDVRQAGCGSSARLREACCGCWRAAGPLPKICGGPPGNRAWMARGYCSRPLVRKLDEHLARLKCADLFLDTLPYNAHTTASDALWAGVPVLTWPGTTFPSRVAASLLHVDRLAGTDRADAGAVRSACHSPGRRSWKRWPPFAAQA